MLTGVDCVGCVGYGGYVGCIGYGGYGDCISYDGLLANILYLRIQLYIFPFRGSSQILIFAVATTKIQSCSSAASSSL